MDVITHVSDLLAFREECKTLAGTVDGLRVIEGRAVYTVDKTPVHYSGNESLALIRANSDADLAHFQHFHRLGVCVDGVYVFDSVEAESTYTTLRGDLAYTYDDGAGNMVEGELPFEIGFFA